MKNDLSLFYSICVAILTYPTAGTPFSDHHTLILCIISLYLFFFAIKTNNQIFWFLIPFFGLRFFIETSSNCLFGNNYIFDVFDLFFLKKSLMDYFFDNRCSCFCYLVFNFINFCRYKVKRFLSTIFFISPIFRCH